MDENLPGKIRAKSTIKTYMGEIIALEKPKGPLILAAPPVSQAYNEEAVAVTQRSMEERICRGEILSYLYPLSAYYENNEWKIRQNFLKPEGVIKGNTDMDTLDLLEEPEYFRETKDGVYALKDAQENFLLTNIRLRIYAHIKTYWDDESEPKEEFKCLLYLKEWDDPKSVTVPLDGYKAVYSSVIKNRFPELFLSSKARDELENYLSRVYSHCKGRWQEEVRIMRIGWTTIGGVTRYELGNAPAYKRFYFPDVSLMDKTEVFSRGFRFLEIGRFQSVSLVPFIFAHFSYAAFFVNKAQREFQSTLFIRGESGAYKTRIATVFCNVFQTDSAQKKLSFGTTRAAFFATMSQLRDQTILLDDFSCSEKRKKRDDTALLEAAIRAIGDSTAPAKMSANQADRIDNRSFRATLVVTGEDNPPLSNSSYYRMIVVPVDKQSYYNDALEKFEQDPAIMRNYMALFIEFLRTNGNKIAEGIPQKAGEYDARYGRNFKVDRVRYAAINLMIVGDMIRQYASWCGVTDSKIRDYMSEFDAIIVDAMLENQEENSGLEPEVMFVYALMQVIGTRDKIGLADSEAIYITNESNYIGFQERSTDTVWLRHEDAEQTVRNYWDKQEKGYTITSPKLHKLLYEKGISIGSKSSDGKAEYLLKAKKGRRKRMLVLKYNKVCQILDSIKE